MGLVKLLVASNMEYRQSKLGKKVTKVKILKTKRYLKQAMNQLIVEMSKERPSFEMLYSKTLERIRKPTRLNQQFECRMHVLLNFPVLITEEKDLSICLKHASNTIPKRSFSVLDSQGQGYVIVQTLLVSMKNLFEQTISRLGSTITIRNNKHYKITIIGDLSVELSLNNKCVASILIIPGILLPDNQWPSNFRRNPFRSLHMQDQNYFCVIPKSSKNKMCSKISFIAQEREILRHRYMLQPIRRLMKQICRFPPEAHAISSYALKTIFLWEVFNQNPNFDRQNSRLWHQPKDCLLHMLSKYLEYLDRGVIPYFWNEEINLLENLPKENIECHKTQIREVISQILHMQSWDEITCSMNAITISVDGSTE